MRRTAILSILALGACHSWLLDKDALGRAMSNNPEAQQILGTDAEPALSVEPGEKYYLEEGPPGDRQIHVYSRTKDSTTVIAAHPLHKYLKIQVITTYAGRPPTTTAPDG